MEFSRKSLVLRALLQQGNVYLHLDATRPGVVVPSHLKDDEALTLVVGPNLAIPVTDMDIGSEGLSATLSFSQRPFHCQIPWNALFGMTTEDGRSLVWLADAPLSVRQAVRREDLEDDRAVIDPSDLFGTLGDDETHSESQGPSEESDGKSPDRSLFGVVEGGKPAADKAPGASVEPPEGGSLPPLRLVE